MAIHTISKSRSAIRVINRKRFMLLLFASRDFLFVYMRIMRTNSTRIMGRIAIPVRFKIQGLTQSLIDICNDIFMMFKPGCNAD